MPRSQQVSWAQLRVGLLVIISLTIFALLIFLMTGQGFFNPKYELRVYMDNAGGLRVGDPVRLSGVDVGNVEDIHISGSHDPKRAIEVNIKVQRKYMDEIRANSEATLAAEGLLGQRFLNISRGIPPSPVVAVGGEVKVKETAEISDVVASSADVMVNLNRITARVDRIMAQVESGKGSLGKIIYDDSLFQKANKSVDQVQELVSYAASGQGSLGKFLMTDELYSNALGTLNKADQVVDDVRSGKGSIGKFIQDPELYNRANTLVGNANGLVTGIQKGQGTLGRLVTDESLYKRTDAALANFSKVGERLEKGEGSAGKLLNDPALYNNVDRFSTELRELLADFRKDPKKFLTIHFKIF